MKKDYYEILGIDKGADAAAIKKAYRKKAIEFHPDKNPGDASAEEKFKEAAEAYEILSDADKKAKYDQYGHAAFDGSGGFGGGGFGGFGGGHMNMEDIFSQFGDIFGGGFGGGGFGGGGQQRAVKGTSLRIKVKLTLEDIANGVEKKIKVKRKVKAAGVTYKTCTTCNGTGQVMKIANTVFGRMQTQSPCGTCHGSGQKIDHKPAGADAEGMVFSDEPVSIKIPAGVAEGMQLKVSRKGNEAPGANSIPGDLLVVIEEVPHETLVREGDNLHYDLYISFAEAALGASKEVDSVNGRLRIKIEEGTQSGKTIALRGKGLPSVNSYGNGELLIHINVWTPKKLTSEQKEFFEKMKGDENFKPSPSKNDKSFFEKVREMFS